MKAHLILVVYLLLGNAQAQDGKVIPNVTTLQIEEGAVTTLHLSPGYATSVRLPDEVSSVVIGNPAAFKAEHSESEPKLVFLKPITAQPSESNALITTKPGHEVKLHLLSAGKAAPNARVDFFVEYRRPQSFLVGPSEGQSFLVADTHPIEPVQSGTLSPRQEQTERIPRNPSCR